MLRLVIAITMVKIKFKAVMASILVIILRDDEMNLVSYVVTDTFMITMNSMCSLCKR